MFAATFVAVSLAAVAAVFVSTPRQAEQAAMRFLCLNRAESMMEEIAGQNVVTIIGYDGNKQDINDEHGTVGTLTVSVDSTDPELPAVTVTANWTVNGGDESLVLYSQFFDEG